MKLVDTNVLIYAYNRSSPEHESAAAWLRRSLSGGSPVGFTWQVLIGFVRLSTHPAVMPQPQTPHAAMAAVRVYLGARTATVLHPGSEHARLLEEQLRVARGWGNLVNDAHLAAIAVEHRAEIVTFDSDFDRFPGVRWERPA